MDFFQIFSCYLSNTSKLTNKFDIKNLGVANIILWIQISKTSDWLIFFQSHYFEKILNNFFKGDYSIVKTPINTSAYLSKNRNKETNQLKYSWIIRNLMYIMNCTRPNIASSVNKLGKFTSDPSMNNLKEIKR